MGEAWVLLQQFKSVLSPTEYDNVLHMLQLYQKGQLDRVKLNAKMARVLDPFPELVAGYAALNSPNGKNRPASPKSTELRPSSTKTLESNHKKRKLKEVVKQEEEAEDEETETGSCWDDATEDEEEIGPSYRAPLKPIGKLMRNHHPALNTSLISRPCARAVNFSRSEHETIMFDREDDHHEAELKVEYLNWAIQRITAKQEVAAMDAGERDRLVARVAMASGSSKDEAAKFLLKGKPDQICKKLNDILALLKKNKEESGRRLSQALEDHQDKARDCYGLAFKQSDTKSLNMDKAFIENLKASGLDPEDDLDAVFVCSRGSVHRDLDMMVRSCIQKLNANGRAALIWGLFVGKIIAALDDPCRLKEIEEAYLEDRSSKKDRLTQQLPIVPAIPDAGTLNSPPNSCVFYGTEHFFVLLKLYMTLYDRMARAHATCRKIDEREKYARFVEIIVRLVQGTVSSGGYEEECVNVLGGDGYLLFTLDKVLVKIVKQLQKIDKDAKSQDAIALFALENLRSRTMKSRGCSSDFPSCSSSSASCSRIDHRLYYANARFAVFLEDDLYKIQCRKRMKQNKDRIEEEEEEVVEIGVSIVDDNEEGAVAGNHNLDFSGHFAQQKWVKNLLHQEFDEDAIFRKNPVFMRRNLIDHAAANEQDIVTMCNGRIQLFTPDGRQRSVEGTEDVFYRFRKRSASPNDADRALEAAISQNSIDQVTSIST